MRLLAVAIVLSVLAGCDLPVPTPPLPSEAEAREYFATVVTLATTGDFEGLCSIGGLNCEEFLDEDGRDPPTAMPWIVGVRNRLQTPTQLGGVIVEICGRKDDGALYYSEMLVFHDALDGNRLKAIEPVYWASIRIPEGQNVGSHIDFDPESKCGDGPP
jgi:hypothetical protein